MDEISIQWYSCKHKRVWKWQTTFLVEILIEKLGWSSMTREEKPLSLILAYKRYQLPMWYRTKADRLKVNIEGVYSCHFWLHFGVTAEKLSPKHDNCVTLYVFHQLPSTPEYSYLVYTKTVHSALIGYPNSEYIYPLRFTSEQLARDLRPKIL